MKDELIDFNTTALNELGYTFETNIFKCSTFFHIKHTFIITMHNSERIKNIWRQINEHIPTIYVTIVYNCGYKNGNKPKNVDTSAKDLWHVNSTIMNMYEGDEPILILEDDCMFLEAFKYNAAQVESLIMKKSNLGAYNLGGIPLLSYPISCYNLRGLIFGFAHAVIYTKYGREQLKNMKFRLLHDIDCSMNTRMYFPIFPLAIQNIEHTDNSKNWDLCGLSFCYLNMFGKKLFHIHHVIGLFGGLLPLIFFIIFCMIFGSFLIIRISL